MATGEARSVESATDVREFPNGKVHVLTIGDTILSRSTMEPGWRWSACVKPISGTDSCQVHHNGYSVSGQLKVRLDDGSELELGPGDAYSIPPGHDGWVVGDEPWVGIDFSPAMATYAKK